MVRIIAGKFKHQRLTTLQGPETRPTSDKLKETLFNLIREEVEESVFLDCFSGSGSVGIEALSRGARDVTLIECAPRAVQVIERNLKTLSPAPPDRVRLLVRPVQVSLRILQRRMCKFDIVFIDPPYDAVQHYPQTLKQIHRCQILAPRACVILEHSRRLTLQPRYHDLSRVRQVRHGDSQLSLYRGT